MGKQFIFGLMLVNFSFFARAAWINPLNVTMISLLIAGPGTELESRYGHSALRVTTNKRPLHTPNDIVINFEAELPPGHRSPLELFLRGVGLTTHYPSLVKASPYHVFKQIYVAAGRALASYPIRLNKEELVRTMNHLNAELATGRGRRPFEVVNYNCAIMTLEAVIAGLGNSHEKMRKTIYPMHLSEILREQNLISSGMFEF